MSPLSSSVAEASKMRVEVAAFSATELVAFAAPKTGLSFASVTETVTACVSFRPSASVAMTLKL